MRAVLQKVIVMKFFRINAGFFLLFFILLFGILNGKETIELHHAFMSGICASPGIAGVAAIVWALYGLKCASFFTSELQRSENSFLYHLQALDNSRQFLLLLQSQCAIYSPLLLYAVITAFVGFKEHRVVLPVLFLLFQVVICVSATANYYNRVNSTWKQPAITLPSFRLFRTESHWWYLLHYSLDSRKGTFAGVKLCSLLLLQTMILANSDRPSQEAVCVLIMFLISAHALLPLYYVRFTERELSFFRNLPLSLVRRFGVYVFTYAVIFLPELLFLLANARAVLPMPLILSLYAIGISQLCLYTSLQYLPRMTTDRYTMVVFVIFFVTLLTLTSSGLWFVFGMEAIVAICLFAWRYYSFETVGE